MLEWLDSAEAMGRPIQSMLLKETERKLFRVPFSPSGECWRKKVTSKRPKRYTG